MLAPFVTAGMTRHDLTVTEGIEALDRPARIKWEYRYTESSLESIAGGWQVERKDDGWRVRGRGDLLPIAMPLIDSLLVDRGLAIVHAGAVDIAGQGVCIAAAGGTGKTSSVAKLSRLAGSSFMGDDFVILSEQGVLLSFPKRIWLKSHHRDVYRGAFQRERRLLLPYRFAQQRLGRVVRPVMSSFPRLREFMKRRSPVLIAVPVDPAEALRTTISDSAPLRVLVLLEAYEGDEVEVTEPDPDVLVSRLLGQFYADVLRESQPVIAALASIGLLGLGTHVEAKTRVIERALSGVRTVRVRVPARVSKDAASDLVLAEVTHLLGAMPTA